MNVVSVISVCIGGISLAISIILTIRNINRDTRSDTEAEAKSKEDMKATLLELNLMTRNINSTTNDIKADVKSLSKNVNDMDTRLVLVEREQKTLWMRIDEIKEKIK